MSQGVFSVSGHESASLFVNFTLTWHDIWDVISSLRFSFLSISHDSSTNGTVIYLSFESVRRNSSGLGPQDFRIRSLKNESTNLRNGVLFRRWKMWRGRFCRERRALWFVMSAKLHLTEGLQIRVTEPIKLVASYKTLCHRAHIYNFLTFTNAFSVVCSVIWWNFEPVLSRWKLSMKIENLLRRRVNYYNFRTSKIFSSNK